MSVEFQLAWPCPHLTVEEVVLLEDVDRMALDTRQPVASMGQVRILANDEFFIPQGGLFSVAQLFSSVSGPFDIEEGLDVLTIETSAGTGTVSFGVTGTRRLTTDRVVSAILAANLEHVTADNEGGFLLLADPSRVGDAAFVRVRGNAASALGFGEPCKSDRPWGARGRMIYPGWDLYLRPDEITNRFPRFRQPIRTNPIFKVTYSVPVARCLRCRATFVENDFRFDQNGHMLLVANEDLLYQAALKILLTDRGSNVYHSWYGTTLRERIGSKALSGVASVLSEDVRRALSNMQAVQIEQSKYQTVTFKEKLYAILAVETRQHQQDPTTFLINVTVQNASGEPIVLNIVFTVPEVVALMGSNGLMLGTQAAGLGVEESRRIFASDRNLLTGGQ